MFVDSSGSVILVCRVDGVGEVVVVVAGHDVAHLHPAKELTQAPQTPRPTP